METKAAGMLYNPAAWQVIAVAVIFLVTYAFVITDKINRAAAALAGAFLILVLGILDLRYAFTEAVGWRVIMLLIGMMLLVGILNRAGVIPYIAIKLAQWVKGSSWKIFILLVALTGISSAFLDNVTIMLLVIPVTMSITKLLKLNPYPFIFAEIAASNIGGAATLIGDPVNMIIGAANKQLTFNAFIVHLGPVSLFILIVTIGLFLFVYRKHFKPTHKSKEASELMKLSASSYIKNRPLMIKSVIVFLLTIIAFTLHSLLGIEPAAIALGSAALLMVIGLKRKEAEIAFRMVDWGTILFFIGLFIMVAGLSATNWTSQIALVLLQMTSGNADIASVLLLWISGIASATMDNVPFVTAMVPVIHAMGAELGLSASQMEPLWWSLSLGANLGSNGTLIGASANVIAAGLALREGKSFHFRAFLKVGAPIAFMSLLVSTAYVYFILIP